MSEKDKLITLSSLEETAKTIKESFPAEFKGGNSLIAVDLVDVDTLTDEVGLLTFSVEIGREVMDSDQIVFKYEDSLYFCDIYSITSQQSINGIQYVIAVVKVLIINKMTSNGETGGAVEIVNDFILPINTDDGYDQIQRGKITNAGAGWNSFKFPEQFYYDVPEVIASLRYSSENVYSLEINNISKTGFQYQIKKYNPPTINTKYYTSLYAYNSTSSSSKTKFEALSSATISGGTWGTTDTNASIYWLAIA